MSSRQKTAVNKKLRANYEQQCTITQFVGGSRRLLLRVKIRNVPADLTAWNKINPKLNKMSNALSLWT